MIPDESLCPMVVNLEAKTKRCENIAAKEINIARTQAFCLTNEASRLQPFQQPLQFPLYRGPTWIRVRLGHQANHTRTELN